MKEIKERRSTREFDTKALAKEEVMELLEAARWAPSAANRQPWLFVVVEGEKKEAFARIMQQELASEKNIKEKDIFATRAYHPTSSVIGSIKVILEAPILLAIFRPKQEEWKEGDYLSIGGAIENICLEATSRGIGSLIIRDVVYTREELAAFLGHADLELVASVVLGYSKEEPYPRKRKALEEIIEWK